MSKNKSKIVRWEYVTKPFDAYVDPERVKRVHAPLEKSLTPDTGYGEYLHLRPCVQGVDEYGVVVKYLYCTRDGRFFARNKDGWSEQQPCTNHLRRKEAGRPLAPKGGGGSDCPFMSHFGMFGAHRCVAVAWCNPPQEALETINDKDAKRVYEVDHLNTDHKNWTADNLQWVTVDENRRRAKIARRMRQIALDPKLLTPTLCKGIYTLPEERIEEFIYKCSLTFANDPSPLTAEAIRLDVAQVLDILKQ